MGAKVIVDTSKLHQHNCTGCSYVFSTSEVDVYIHLPHVVLRDGDRPRDTCAYFVSELGTLRSDTIHLEALLRVRELVAVRDSLGC